MEFLVVYCIRFYHVLWIFTTIILIGWCISMFTLDNDVSKVEYSFFHGTKNHLYPSVSLCFSNVILQERLNLYNVTVSVYQEFLKGNAWDNKFVDIDYQNATMDLTKSVLAIEYFQEGYDGEMIEGMTYLYDNTKPQGTKVHNVSQWKPHFYMDDNPYRGYVQKCLSVDVDYVHKEHFSWISIAMNKSVFSQQRRPYYFLSGDHFAVMIHYPKQRLLYSNIKLQWDKAEPNGSYGMRFAVSDFEVIQRRNKATNPCDAGRPHDDNNVKVGLMKNISCIPPYWIYLESDKKMNCKSSQQMKKIFRMPVMDHVEPCLTMSKISYEYTEYLTKYFEIRLNKSLGDHFYVTLHFPRPTYKHIELIQEYSIQTLIGNAGGYIGICVGYSFLQLPYLLRAIWIKIKDSMK